MNNADIKAALDRDIAGLAKIRAELDTLRSGGSVENLTVAGAEATIAGFESCIAAKRRLLAETAA